MASVFEDITENDYDLSIVVSSEWTVDPASLPNGNDTVWPNVDGTNYVSNLNGDDFDFSDGTAWTIEFWFRYSDPVDVTIYQTLICNGLPLTEKLAWGAIWRSDEKMFFIIQNTGTDLAPDNNNYLLVVSAVLSTHTWYHFVIVKETGDVLKMYVNGSIADTDNTPNGTVRPPTDEYRIYLGQFPNRLKYMDSTTYDLRVAKIAIYNRELTTDEINTHYLTMTS